MTGGAVVQGNVGFTNDAQDPGTDKGNLEKGVCEGTGLSQSGMQSLNLSTVL